MFKDMSKAIESSGTLYDMPNEKIISLFLEKYFELESPEKDIFVGHGYRKTKQVYGGQLLGQSLYSAFQTLSDQFFVMLCMFSLSVLATSLCRFITM